MSIPITRLGDKSAGHGYPPVPSIECSPNVFVNGKGVVIVGNKYAVHCIIGCHQGALSTGSPTVFVNNLPVGRIGDSISCGDTVAEGSPNVFAG